jgi:transaldolase/glucose-6-phosphate isomerase
MNNTDDIYIKEGSMTDAIECEIDHWKQENKILRLWQSDPTLWTNNEENKWTGWLSLASETMAVPRIQAFAQEIKTAGFIDIVLLGMGGSSLCPSMMAETFGKIGDYPRLHILDSTDPAQILHLEEKIDLEKTLFIVSSKSGSTLEPNIFKEYFFARLQQVLNTKEVGDRFVAITDPGTTLETMAHDQHFRAIFHGVPSDGGRYSALSNFGMVPSGLMGVDVKAFLQHAQDMQQRCLPEIDASKNPGLILGVILGVAEKLGHNKVTLIVTPTIHALGAWIEQLLAESTGKQGKGLIPVDQEPLGEPGVYSEDRLFVYIRLEDGFDPAQDRAITALEQAGFFVVKLHLPNKMHLGAELFRWEFATAVAGSIIGIDPFNQPDVEASKVLALKITAQYEESGNLTEPSSLISADGMTLFTDDKNAGVMTKQLSAKPAIAEYLRVYLDQVKRGDYVDFSAFIEMSDENTTLLQQCRTLIRDRKKVATCLGFGPRFLHSTGQAYKGGPNTGVFLQITADHLNDIQVPEHRYTFGLVITAQAQADFNVLIERSRRILRIHLGNDVKGGLQRLFAELKIALQITEQT